MGTADKVCAAMLAVHEHCERRRCDVENASFVLLELGGAFTAAIAVERGRIVDGQGGTSGALGPRAAGALDGEVAFLAGSISKQMLFGGGADTVAGGARWMQESPSAGTPLERLARDAYLEAVIKAVAALRVSAATVGEVVLSGRLAGVEELRRELTRRLAALWPDISVQWLRGFASRAGHAAQGSALIADGLAGGGSAGLVEALGIRDASGTCLDYLHVITPAQAHSRLGIG